MTRRRTKLEQRLERQRQELLAQPVTAPPDPWQRVGNQSVGGLLAVGFAPGSDLLLVVSTAGRSVVDARTGERLARDRDDTLAWLEPQELTAQGIGPLAGQDVRLVGLYGGGLTLGTADGWALAVQTLAWPDQRVVLTYADWSQGAQAARAGERVTVIADESELRAAGFSPTGHSLVVASSSDLQLFTRP